MQRSQSAVEHHVTGATEQRKPAHRRVRDATTKHAECRPTPTPGDQRPRQNGMQQRTAKTDQHQGARPPECVAKRIKRPVEQRGRHAPGKHREIAARLRLDARVDMRQREQGIRIEQKNYAGNRQQHSQPESLLQRPGNLAIAFCAFQMRHRRRHRLQNADQRKHYRDIDAATHRHGRQILGAIVAEQGGVDHHHAH